LYSDSNNDGGIDRATEIIEESNYYPFGLEHKGYNNVTSSNGNSVAQKFGFGGKELSEELGLNTMDFGARNYDASLGRWMNLDPLAEQMRRHSPYNYAFDNPIRFIDPDGMKPFAEEDCCGNWNPVSGIGDGIARSFETAVNKANKSLSDMANSIASLFKEDIEPTVDTGDAFVEVGAEVAAKETGSKLAKNITRKTGVLGTVNALTSLTIKAAENGISEDLVQKGAGEVISNATGPAAPFTQIVLENGKSDDGITNTSNMSNNFAQSGRSRNAYIYRNFTMRNQRTIDTRPATERNRAAAEKAKNNPIARFWLRVLPARD
jgi:RHS repeat-associated protein